MNRYLGACWLLLCSMPVGAQYYSPHPSFSSHAGQGASYYFGDSPRVRYQLADSTLRNKVVVISNIRYRMKGWAMTARRWSAATLYMSETNMSAMTKTLSTNITSPPTHVFSGSVSWPGLGAHKPGPHPWFVAVPFNKGTYLNTGRADLLADYSFAGGALANGATWNSTIPVNCYLDSFRINTYSAVGGRTLLAGAGGCRDSTNTKFAAYTHMSFFNYGPTHSQTNYRNTMSIRIEAHGLPRLHPVVTVAGIKANPAGFVLPGVMCEKMFVDFSALTFIFVSRTDNTSVGQIPHLYLTRSALGPVVPANPLLIGFSVVAQSAWDDKGNGRLLLSAGSLGSMLRLPPFNYQSVIPRRAVAEWPTLGGTRVAGPIHTPELNPICRYN